jgi:Integrase zinc binding domain
LKRGVISLFHDPPTAGHPRITKTMTLAAQHYWWPGMKDFVTAYVKGCTNCQMSKINMHPNKPAMFPISTIPNILPFQTIALDFIVKLPTSEGFDTILTITDHDCLKASVFIPCNEAVDAPGVARLYANHVFPHYGIPTKVISDHNPWFTTHFAKELCGMLGIKQNISTAYHPQTDGQSERTNQSLEQYLRLYCASQQDQWANWLPIAQYTRNSWPHSTMKKTPYDLILGYTPQAHQPTAKTDLLDIETQLLWIKEAQNAAQEAIRKSQEGLIKATKFKATKKDRKYG